MSKLYQENEDPRLGTLITKYPFSKLLESHSEIGQHRHEKRIMVGFLGFPYDIGVARNGGRVGARKGPESVRKFLNILGTVFNHEFDVDLEAALQIFDLGDVPEDLELEEAHKLLEKIVTTAISADMIPFVVGGGNDQSYPNACGLINALNQRTQGQKIGVVNIDAHLDVRPLKEGKVHSGSPFRLLLTEKAQQVENFCEFAAQGSQCSKKHAKFVEENNGFIYWFFQLENCVLEKWRSVLQSLGQNIFVSFDLDSVTGADAPGVSCPGTVGLTSQQALMMCYEAGKNPNVKLFDLSEYNPVIEEYRTGRLVVNMFYYFLLGLSKRKQ